MKINRHNYEEFFLLYADGELSAADRSMVELFAAANPDLKEELNLLQQTRFTPEVQLETSFIHSMLKPLEEEPSAELKQLLLYIDEELTKDQRTTIEQSLYQSPVLQTELKWLQKTKLKADTTVLFPGKTALYKKDEETAIVFHMGLFVRRMAAAASVLLILSAGWWFINPSPTSENKSATIIPAETPARPASDFTAKAEEKNRNASDGVDQAEGLPTGVKNNLKNTTTIAGKNKMIQTTTSENQQPPTLPSTDLQEPIVSATQSVIAEINNSVIPSNKTLPTTVPSETNTAANVSFASYNNTSDDDDEEDGFLNEEQQRRSGIKGFLKRAKRTIERRTGIQSGESQVRFAVFAVNTQ